MDLLAEQDGKEVRQAKITAYIGMAFALDEIANIPAQSHMQRSTRI